MSCYECINSSGGFLPPCTTQEKDLMIKQNILCVVSFMHIGLEGGVEIWLEAPWQC